MKEEGEGTQLGKGIPTVHVSACMYWVTVYPVHILCTCCMHADGVYIPMRMLGLISVSLKYVLCYVFKLCACMHVLCVCLLHVSLWTGREEVTYLGAFGCWVLQYKPRQVVQDLAEAKRSHGCV